MKSVRRFIGAWLFASLSIFSSSTFAIAVNDAIKATAVLNVRQTASTSGTILGEKSSGSVGTITSGPTVANGYTWWHIVWNTGSPNQGWSASTNLALNTPTPKNFNINGGIQVTTGTTNTRSTASTAGTLLAAKAVGSTGVVVGGPTTANGYVWWKINWTGGPTNGWSVQDYLTSYTFPSTVTGVTASCSPLSVQVGQTSQCTATVSGTGSYSSAVNWSVSNGSITSSGLLTAPATVPAGNNVLVLATSVQDSSKYGTRLVSVSAGPSTVTSVSVNCSPLTVVVNQTSQCTATVSGTGSYSSAVNWSASSGAVNASGYYAAPSSVPAGGAATVTATSVQNSSKSGARELTITATPGWTQPSSEVFRDTTGTGWYIEQWAGVTNNPVSPMSQNGEYGLLTTTTTQWGRVQLTAWANHRFNTTGYNSVSFWVNIGKHEGEQLYVGLLNSGYTAITYVPIANTSGFTPYSSYTWKYVTIPLASLGASNIDIYGVEFQSANPATWSIDELKLNTSGVCTP